jgi:hypothetical protein
MQQARRLRRSAAAVSSVSVVAGEDPGGVVLSDRSYPRPGASAAEAVRGSPRGDPWARRERKDK